MPVMSQVMAVTLAKFRKRGCSFTATFVAEKTQHPPLINHSERATAAAT